MRAGIPSRGRSEYVRLMAQSYLRGATGSVDCRSGRNHRVFHLVEGRPVGLESDRPQDAISAVLVKGDFVTDANLGRVMRSSTGGEPLDELLVKHARVDPRMLQRRLEKWMMGAVGAPLGWPKVDVRFTPAAGHSMLVQRQAIGTAIPVLRALWRGVGKHMTDAEARAELTAQGARPLYAAPALGMAINELDLDPGYRRLGEVLRGGKGVDEALAEVGDRAGTGVRLLWFLEIAGAVGRTPPAPERAAAEEPTERNFVPPRFAPPTPDGEVARMVTAVQEGYDLRMQGDYYAFLMISRSAPADRIKLTCGRLQRRWTKASERSDLPDATRAQVDELLRTLPLVYRTLADPGRRNEYDRRLAAGRAPMVGGIRGADRVALENTTRRAGSGAAPAGDITAALELIEGQDWPRAAGILDRLRMQNPSDPDVLANLGWARFHLGGEVNVDAAEDYLRLALTFEPSHLRALEYAARIALDQGDHDVAESRLRRLLAKDASARWARKALRDIQSA